MAIRIIEGVPGSGKSYYAVRHLATNYFELSHDEYVVQKPCTIITNIEDFQPDHVSLDEEMKKAGGLERFFSLEFQEQYRHNYPDVIVYMIDEAQMIFRRAAARSLGDVFAYFEYHRHFGQDIYLITQNSRKLPPDITALTEYIIVACPRTRSIVGELRYKWVSDGDIIKREGFKPDKRIFALYKSMDQAETEKIKNPVMRTFAVVMVASVLVIGGGFWFFNVHWLKASETSSDTTSPTDSKSQVSSVPIVTASTAELPARALVHFVPLPTITIIDHLGVSHVSAVWGGVIAPINELPHKTFYRRGQWYVSLDDETFNMYFPPDSAEIPPGHFSVIEKRQG